MSLRQSLTDQMKQAMKSRDAAKLSVLRFLLSEIKNVEIDAKHELEDQEIIALLRKEVKRRKEAVEQYKTAGRDDIVTHELSELEVINTFLPAQMTPEAVEQIIVDIIAKSPDQDFGQVMRQVMQSTKGQADGKLVSDIVRSKLN